MLSENNPWCVPFIPMRVPPNGTHQHSFVNVSNILTTFWYENFLVKINVLLRHKIVTLFYLFSIRLHLGDFYN